MTQTVGIIVGGSIEEDGAAFIATWKASERGQDVKQSRVIAFESWDSLSAVLTSERYRLLRHLRGHPEPTVSALARSLGCQFRRVHGDVAALEVVGSVNRSEGDVRAIADRIWAEIVLWPSSAGSAKDR